MKQHRPQLRAVISFAIPLVTSCLLAAVVAIWDLDISQALASPHNPLGRALELPGQLIAPLLGIFSGITLLASPRARPHTGSAVPRLLIGSAAALGGSVFSCFIFSSFSAGISIVCALLLAAGSMLWTAFLLYGKPFPPDSLYRIAATVIVHILLLLVVISLIKLFWGRLRYRDMLDISGFSHWFIPQGITGNYSFPSGHTAYCASIWAITLFASLTQSRWKKVLCYLLPAAAILVMASSRVLAGAHYVSDVLMGAGLSLALFYVAVSLVRHIFSSRSHR